jgi:hypothetical protein
MGCAAGSSRQPRTCSRETYGFGDDRNNTVFVLARSSGNLAVPMREPGCRVRKGHNPRLLETSKAGGRGSEQYPP